MRLFFCVHSLTVSLILMKLKPLIPFHCLYINSYFYLLLNVFLHTISIRCVDDIFFSFDRFSFGHTHTHTFRNDTLYESVFLQSLMIYSIVVGFSTFIRLILNIILLVGIQMKSGLFDTLLSKMKGVLQWRKKKKVYRKLSLSIKRGQIKYSKEYFQQLHLQCYFVIYSSEIIYFCKHI